MIRLIHAAAGLGGGLLAIATRLVAAVRSAPKPLHPRGSTWTGELTRFESDHLTGETWWDQPGRHEVVVRVSAAVGFPPGWPDIQGLAIRFLGPDHDVDLLLASTGSGRFTRHLLRLVRPNTPHFLTTLLPYRGASGPVVFAASRGSDTEFMVLSSHGSSEWKTIGRLHLEARSTTQEVSFDPIVNPPPGLENYAWVEWLRAPAYRAARAARRKSSTNRFSSTS